MVYTVAELKRCQEIVFIRKIDAPAVGVINSDRKCWLATQKFFDMNPICAVKIDKESEWRGKGDFTPSSAYVHKYALPCAAARGSR